VVKPLGKQLRSIPLYAGATIMGDGRVALILDANALARQAGMVSFVTLFRMLGLLFLIVVPLVLLMRRPQRHGRPTAAH